MEINIFRPFTALGTRLTRNSADDPFVVARFKTTLLYLAFICVASFIVGILYDRLIAEIISEGFSRKVPITAQELTTHIATIRTFYRAFNVGLFSIAVYMLLGFTLRPIKDLLEAQKRFIANISHELRTPLTLAKTELEVVLRNPQPLTRDEAVSALESNLNHISHVSRIIQFLLELSDFNTEQPESFKRIVALDTITQQTVMVHQSEAVRNGVDMRFDFRTDDTNVTGNPIALEKMITNLVRNAITYTPAGGIVTISLFREAGKLKLSVRDTGRGIGPSDLPHVFETFFRAKNATPHGTGVGLSIVKEVARIHGATVAAQSTEGEGSTFTVTFGP